MDLPFIANATIQKRLAKEFTESTFGCSGSAVVKHNELPPHFLAVAEVVHENENEI